jgi:hypothetical protein
MPELHQLDTDAGFFRIGPGSLDWLRVGVEAIESRIANFVMSDDPDDPSAPLASLLWLPPGFVLPRHSHSCHRVEVVVRGSLTIEGHVLHPGDVSVSRPNEFYGPNIAGPTGSLSVEIFSHSEGIIPSPADGQGVEQQQTLERFAAAVEEHGRNGGT